MNLEITQGQGNSRIADYVYECQNSLLYHSPRFISLVSQHLNADSFWISAVRNGQLLGVLPYMVYEGPMGPVFNSLAYYGSNGGIVQKEFDLEVKKKLINTFYNEAALHKACSATIVTNPLEKDFHLYRETSRYDCFDERIGQITELDGYTSDSQLMECFSDPRPRNIRRAIKENLEIQRTQSPQAIEFLYELHRQNIESIGGLPKERDFFERLSLHMLKEEWQIYTAKKDGRDIAALLLFYYNNTVEYFTPAIDADHRNKQPLALIIFNAMSDALSLGMKRWNWGGTWLSQKGVYDFKKRWNARDLPYFYFTRIFNNEVFSQSKEFFLNEYKGFYVVPFSNIREKS